MNAGVGMLKRVKPPVNVYELKQQLKLPKPYQKFYKEWKLQEPKPVHYIPRKEKWERLETGEVKPVQNVPIPLLYPNEMHQGIWGGEAAFYGLVKRKKYRCPTPKFWTPQLKESVVYSEILDKYLEVTVTERAMRLIDEHCGFDNYLLETPACDLVSLLALTIKRRILLALIDKDFLPNNPKRREQLIEKYKQYIIPREEAEWYGLSLHEAKAKLASLQQEEKLKSMVPLKMQFRQNLLRRLQEEQIKISMEPPKETPSWTSKFNPFKKPEAAV